VNGYQEQLPMHRPSLLVFALLSSLMHAQVHAADTHVLAAQHSEGDVTAVKIALEVGGELKVVDGGKVKPLKMSVVANMAYDECLVAADGQKRRSLRYYDQAEAVIKIEQGGAKPTLPDSRRVICADWQTESVVLVHPEAPLSREQLDLISLPADTLVIDALLPGEPVAQGESWQHAEPLVAALLRLDAVSKSDAHSVLKQVVAGRTATAEISGQVDGAVDGVSTKIELKGRYTYDFSQRRITNLVLLIKEQRSVGHVATGLDVVSKLQLTVGELAESKHLTPAVMEQVKFNDDPLRMLLAHESLPGGFRLLHDRRWHAVSDDPKLLTMRYVDRGDLIAQCNVSPLEKSEPGKHITLEKFQTEIQQALSDKFGQFLKASEESDGRGWTIYRVIAGGMVSELPIIWHYYLVADQDGHQIAFAFTLEEGLVQRFDEADRALVDSVGFLELPVASASRPSSIRIHAPDPTPSAGQPAPEPPSPSIRVRAATEKPASPTTATKAPTATAQAAPARNSSPVTARRSSVPAPPGPSSIRFRN
jgi:hypothetical protein